eukprot:GHVN01029527.1.p1 GENE.GHVN01029527.1~~GHVN01029527.1.p1  ORF type:complete len:294 (+),score=48.36 GHVN01029527.1:291-1172(+)
MGCLSSANSRTRSGCDREPPRKTVSIYPDLGWRVCPAEVMMDLHHHAAHNACVGLPPMYPQPDSWNVTFSYAGGRDTVFRVSIVVLGLNIAVRSASLWRRFHSVQPSDQHPWVKPDENLGIFRGIGVPNYHWTLVQRRSLPPSSHPNSVNKKQKHDGWSQQHHQMITDPLDLTHPHSSQRELQLMEVPCKVLVGRGLSGVSEEDEGGVWSAREHVLVDVAAIGMNIAQNLVQLEGPNLNHQYPTNLFGWQILNHTDGLRIGVASPDGIAYMVVPEELIMSVKSWFQESYCTHS